MLPFVARREPGLVARVVSERHLVYGDDQAPVRGSGMAMLEGRMVVVEDEADRIAVIEGAGGSVVGLPLRAPVAGPGAPRGRLQLEAMLAARDWRGEYLLAFGSGSRLERRCVARVRLSGGDTDITVFETRKLYEALDEMEGFAGSRLDIEGVALVPRASAGRDVVRLFHRGHGAPRTSEPPWPATIDVRLDALNVYLERCKRDPDAWLGLDLENVRRYDLGAVAGVPIGFTDAAALPSGKVLFVGTAEMPMEGEEEGEALCSVLGVIEPDGSARYNFVLGPDGQPMMSRADGIAVVSETRGYLVVDQSDPSRPSLLCDLVLGGL